MNAPSKLLMWIVLPGLIGCGTLEYDLSSVPVPVSAKPADAADGPAQPLLLTAKNILWVHGLFGHTMPDVAEQLTEASRGYDRIANFRVRTGPGFHDWLITHLTLSLIRMKTVVISGELVGGPPREPAEQPAGQPAEPPDPHDAPENGI